MPDDRQGELPVYPASSPSARHFAASQLFLGVGCAVTHFADEKPEAQAKEVMVFLKSAARQLQWVGLRGPLDSDSPGLGAQGGHSCPRTCSCVRQDQLSTEVYFCQAL